jgi:hypothetical protein
MRTFAIWCVTGCVLASGPAVVAGVHLSTDQPNPLPAKWRGFLLDLRALRLAANPGAGANASNPLRETYLDAALKLEAKAKAADLSADDLADLGAIHLRLGQAAKAVAVLRPAARRHPEHFRLAANLGTAWHLTGDLDQAAAALDEAVRLAPERWKPAERLHLKLVRSRAKERKGADALDDLFADEKPEDRLALGQQLCVWLPADARLLWQLAEVAHTLGDVRTAATLLDGAVTEYGLASAAARDRRKQFRTTADELEKAADHRPFDGIRFASPRVFPRRFDVSRLPKIDPAKPTPLPWGALDETEIGKKFAVKYLGYVSDLDGKPVSISGYMQPVRADEVTAFVLTEFPVGCWFCESPGPLQAVQVEAADGKPVPMVRGMVTVTGTLQLNRSDPERMLFTVTDARVKLAE